MQTERLQWGMLPLVFTTGKAISSKRVTRHSRAARGEWDASAGMAK